MTALINIDTCGLSCPQPMLMVKNKLEEIGKGRVSVLADSTASYENISRMAAHLGWTKTVDTQDGDVFTLEFTKEDSV